jgi:hypothetical protein
MTIVTIRLFESKASKSFETSVNQTILLAHLHNPIIDMEGELCWDMELIPELTHLQIDRGGHEEGSRDARYISDSST